MQKSDLQYIVINSIRFDKQVSDKMFNIRLLQTLYIFIAQRISTLRHGIT